MELQVKVMKLHERDISEIISMGLVGISYWASDIEVVNKKGEMCDKGFTQGLIDGCTVSVDTLDNETVSFTLADLKTGVEKAINEYDVYRDEYIDANGADIIIQYAAFGEVIYG